MLPVVDERLRLCRVREIVRVRSQPVCDDGNACHPPGTEPGKLSGISGGQACQNAESGVRREQFTHLDGEGGGGGFVASVEVRLQRRATGIGWLSVMTRDGVYPRSESAGKRRCLRPQAKRVGWRKQMPAPEQFAQRVMADTAVRLRAAATLKLEQQVGALVLKARGEFAQVVQREPERDPVQHGLVPDARAA